MTKNDYYKKNKEKLLELSNKDDTIRIFLPPLKKKDLDFIEKNKCFEVTRIKGCAVERKRYVRAYWVLVVFGVVSLFWILFFLFGLGTL